MTGYYGNKACAPNPRVFHSLPFCWDVRRRFVEHTNRKEVKLRLRRTPIRNLAKDERLVGNEADISKFIISMKSRGSRENMSGSDPGIIFNAPSRLFYKIMQIL